MKVLLVFIALLFSVPILLIACIQLIRLVLNELTEMALEAWHSPEMQ